MCSNNRMNNSIFGILPIHQKIQMSQRWVFRRIILNNTSIDIIPYNVKCN